MDKGDVDKYNYKKLSTLQPVLKDIGLDNATRYNHFLLQFIHQWRKF